MIRHFYLLQFSSDTVLHNSFQEWSGVSSDNQIG